LRHPLQDRFGPLRRERDRKRCVRVGPDQDQHGHLPATLWKVDLDLTEIGLDPLAWQMIQRDECLALFFPLLPDAPLDRRVTAKVCVLVPQPFKDPHRRMTLLWRSGLILLEDLPDDLVKRSQLRRHLPLSLLVRQR